MIPRHTCPLKPGSLGTMLQGPLILGLPYAVLALRRRISRKSHEGTKRRAKL
jgi:hypothetical protein